MGGEACLGLREMQQHSLPCDAALNLVPHMCFLLVSVPCLLFLCDVSRCSCECFQNLSMQVQMPWMVFPALISLHQ